MPEYVYALHDFLPEHEDEITFHAGEKVEVVEKDDQFGDGWWQGRNLEGKVGLFPVDYTTKIPPASAASSHSAASSSVLQPLAEESEGSESPLPHIVSPVPVPPPAPSFLNNDGYESDVGETQSSALLSAAPDGEVMRATMTDVQKAIEQLGRGGAVGEDQRSFSFASTRDGGDTETDTDFDLSDLDGADDGADGTEAWHKNARRKLAAKAKRAVEEAEKLEALMAGTNDSASTRRAVAPPIEVEVSDESDAEDESGDFTRTSRFQRNHPGILEEVEEEAEVDQNAGHAKEASASATEIQRSSTQVVVPPKDDTDLPTATATTLSFPVFSPPPATVEETPQPVAQPILLPERSAERPPSPKMSPAFPRPLPSPPTVPVMSIPSPIITNALMLEQEPKRTSMPMPVNGMPSPSASTHFGKAIESKHNSIMSSSSAPSMSMPVPQHAQQELTSPDSELKKKHPSDWTVDEVVEWLRSKGFDQDVCDKFTEQEITGDVLLELDVNLLKAEIGIMAFGKRVRIANAITDLRRPPSIEYSDHHASSELPSPMHMQMPMHMNQHPPSSPSPFGGNGMPMPVHSRTQSQSQSHHSFPGTNTTTMTHGYTQSVQSSLGSPMGYGPNGGGGLMNGSSFAGTTVPESPATTAHSDGVLVEPVGLKEAINGKDGIASGIANASGVGLGIALSPTGKGRPSQLSLSPSDGALKHSATKGVLAISGPIDDEDRGHMSEGEIVPSTTSMRRRIFGRSHDSAASVPHSTRSKDSPQPSPNDFAEKDLKDKDSSKGSAKDGPKDKVKQKDKDKKKEDEKEKEKDKEGSARDSSSIRSRHARGKKSIDGGKPADRLSIFGGTFSGTLGKTRKPAPSAPIEEHPIEKTSSKFSLPRLHGPSIRKASSNSHRPSTPTSPKDKHTFAMGDSPGKEKHKEKEKDVGMDKDAQKAHATLRKRTTSTPAAASNGIATNATTEGVVNGVSGPIKQGQSILEQIGDPDHMGWIRKRGERYNTWKLRYFVLKGEHLYYLKSNSKSETRIKGYIHIVGYKVTVDENVDPGRYGFRIDHDHDKTHYFSSEEKTIVRDWMKAIMKATIGRDYTKPVVSSCNIPTIPLVVAQAMNPAPRPPSPTARDATQKALRRDNTDQLSSRDARVLMGLPGQDGKDPRTPIDSFFNGDTSTINDLAPLTPRRTSAPPRPSREMRRSSSVRTAINVADDTLIEWANSHLPAHLQITDPTGPLCGGLALLRLAESIKGRPSSPPVPDSAFPTDANDDKLDGLFRLFDFLLDNDVKMGSVSINDVRQGKKDKIVQLLRALKTWEDKRRTLANTLANPASTHGYVMVM